MPLSLLNRLVSIAAAFALAASLVAASALPLPPLAIA